jgi:short-subunit dehydrogenase
MHHAYRTALVTGASSGIGLRLATLLAGDGCSVVIVARRTVLLEALASRLRAEHNVSVEVLTADLTSPAGLAAAEARLSDSGRPVELLVNNAGISSSGPFAELPLGTAEDQIRLNVTAVVRLTHAALPGMLRRGHGGVLNVSSVVGFVPSPRSAAYGATKAFVTTFSENLSAELKPRGVHVTALCPGVTRTENRGQSASGLAALAWLDTDKVARAGLDAVTAGRVLTVPGAQYKSVVSLTRSVPRGVLRSAVNAAATLTSRVPR